MTVTVVSRSLSKLQYRQRPVPFILCIRVKRPLRGRFSSTAWTHVTPGITYHIRDLFIHWSFYQYHLFVDLSIQQMCISAGLLTDTWEQTEQWVGVRTRGKDEHSEQHRRCVYCALGSLGRTEMRSGVSPAPQPAPGEVSSGRPGYRWGPCPCWVTGNGWCQPRVRGSCRAVRSGVKAPPTQLGLVLEPGESPRRDPEWLSCPKSIADLCYPQPWTREWWFSWGDWQSRGLNGVCCEGNATSLRCDWRIAHKTPNSKKRLTWGKNEKNT